MREILRQLAEELEQHRDKDNWDLFDDLSVERHADDPDSIPRSYRLHGLISLIESESLDEIDNNFTELERAFEEILTFLETGTTD